jgi:hypothetical protein
MYKKLLTASVVASMGFAPLMASAEDETALPLYATDREPGYVQPTADGSKPNPVFYGSPAKAGRWDNGKPDMEAEQLPEGVTEDQVMKAGTVINAANFDKVKDMYFEGKRVGDMITEKIEWMIREKNLAMNIRHSEFIEMDEKYMQATQDGKGKVKFDPETRAVSGWEAGMFFDPQEISMDDPHAGDKLIWNLRSPTYGATMDLRHISWVFLDGEDGMERIQRWWARRYYMEGRLDGGPLVEGDGDIMQKNRSGGNLSPGY